MTIARWGIAAIVLSLFGCGGSGGGADGGSDAAPPDATIDSAADGTIADSGPDAMADSGSDALLPPDAGPPIEPGDPGAADVRFDVDTTADVHAISPYIYGHNQPDLGIGTTMVRAGGNRWTAYNWENNASNAGSDWCHQNDGLLGGGDTAGLAIGQRVEAAHASGAAALVTVPIVDHLAADKAGGSDPPGCSGDVQNSGADFLTTRFRRNHPSKGAALVYPPDTSDGAVYQDEFVEWLEASYGAGTLLYSLDNEPDLWADTHARIHPDALTYDELLSRGIAYAGAIKDVAPDALVFGPVNFGWSGMTGLQDAPDADGRNFLAFYLAAMAAEEASSGRRLLDVLDFHWYPEAQGGGGRITADGANAGMAEARMQAPRSLWDATYTEDSWIAMWSTSGPVRLLPRLRELIDTNYPGTRMAITEYYYGGGAHISGAIAQADVLGIYGREALFAAALWHIGGTDDTYIRGGFAAYRDYDGAGATFGDVSVRAVTDDSAGTSVHGSLHARSPERVVLVAINKTDAAMDAAVRVRHAHALTTLSSYVVSDGTAMPTAGASVDATADNAFVYTMPPLSVSTLTLE